MRGTWFRGSGTTCDIRLDVHHASLSYENPCIAVTGTYLAVGIGSIMGQQGHIGDNADNCSGSRFDMPFIQRSFDSYQRQRQLNREGMSTVDMHSGSHIRSAVSEDTI